MKLIKKHKLDEGFFNTKAQMQAKLAKEREMSDEETVSSIASNLIKDKLKRAIEAICEYSKTPVDDLIYQFDVDKCMKFVSKTGVICPIRYDYDVDVVNKIIDVTGIVNPGNGTSVGSELLDNEIILGKGRSNESSISYLVNYHSKGRYFDEKVLSDGATYCLKHISTGCVSDYESKRYSNMSKSDYEAVKMLTEYSVRVHKIRLFEGIPGDIYIDMTVTTDYVYRGGEPRLEMPGMNTIVKYARFFNNLFSFEPTKHTYLFFSIGVPGNLTEQKFDINDLLSKDKK